MTPELWTALLWPLVMVTATALAALVRALTPPDPRAPTHTTTPAPHTRATGRGE